MELKQLALEIIKNVGGESNISNLTHCATRLRFELKNDTLANLDVLKSLDGVLTAQIQGEQTQVVIGGKVGKVYDEIMKNIHISADTSEKKEKKEKNPVSAVFSAIAGIFAPTLPVLIGCGMFKALGTLLTGLELLTAQDSLVIIINMIGDLIFYFFPFFLAVSAAKKFKTNEFLALALAAAYMYPTIMNGAAAAAEGGPATMTFLGLPILFVNYKSTVIPIILSVWVLKYVYKYVDKIVPDIVKVFLTPMLVLIILVPVELIVLGPIGSYLGVYVAQFIDWFYNAGGILAAAFLGSMRSVLTMFGLHYALSPLQIQQIATTGGTTLLVSALANNFAQSGAAFGTALAIKDKSKKTAAFGAALSAFFGITEPAMYGVNLIYKRPFVFAMASAAVSAAFLQIFHTVGLAYVPPGIFTIISFQADSFIFVILGVVIAFMMAAILSFLFGVKKEENTTSHQEQALESNIKEEDIMAPVQGEIIDIRQMNDETFASEIMGKGIGIIPKEGKVCAPFNGKVTMVFPTGHALGITSNQGTEMLIHIGVNTVEENGKGFDLKVKENQTIHQGDLLVEFDLEALKEKYDMTIACVITNTDAYKSIKKYPQKDADSSSIIMSLEV